MRDKEKNEKEVTHDYLLGGRVAIQQPAQGYRVAIDPVFLAASIQAEPGDLVLDIGAGVGAASLCLATRLPDCKVVGLEVQRQAVRLAAENVRGNQLRDRVEILSGDLLRPPPRLAAGTFAHVMANPPYLETSHANPVSAHGKELSHVEGNVSLEQWAKFALLMVKPKGFVTFIHRADRLDHVLQYFSGKLGELVIYPLWPGEGKPAKRVLIRGRKNVSSPTTLASGLVLHTPDGKYTQEAEAILRHGAGLYF